MAPTRTAMTDISTRALNKVGPLPRRPISTRTQQKLDALSENVQNIISNVGKRKADASPVRNEKTVKRAALGNVTNAVLNANEIDKKLPQRSKAAVQAKVSQIATKKPAPAKPTADEASKGGAVPKAMRGPKVGTRSSMRFSDAATKAGAAAVVATATTTITEATHGMEKVTISSSGVSRKSKAITANPKAKLDVVREVAPDKENINTTGHAQKGRRNSRRLSTAFGAVDCEDSHYLSALEDLSSSRLSFGERRISTSSDTSVCTISSTATTVILDKTLRGGEPQLPDGVDDFDQENLDDPYQVSEYAMDIFEYLKGREPEFAIEPYMHRQPQLTTWIRTLLVDWMVELQETFELNHETLYLAVKIVDIYLSKVTVARDKLQLVGAASMLIACKYDERIPVSIDDFLVICDGVYKQPELIRMEMDAFRTIGYDLGIPLSYRFLRRYGRCARITMPELTLARYILEYSLMTYDVVSKSDSKMAAACLFMAMRMSNKVGWSRQLQYYTGYKLDDFKDLLPLLNDPLHKRQSDANKAVRNKYAHKIFFEVSKIKLLTNVELLEGADQIETF